MKINCNVWLLHRYFENYYILPLDDDLENKCKTKAVWINDLKNMHFLSEDLLLKIVLHISKKKNNFLTLVKPKKMDFTGKRSFPSANSSHLNTLVYSLYEVIVFLYRFYLYNFLPKILSFSLSVLQCIVLSYTKTLHQLWMFRHQPV